ncbi:hypothetical protein HGRIS_005133 [Hohenbuehelia grisea]|uniref:FAD-binding domain-containing protein n=1 Tax=Hohenbuehelia grisea TaxID=104357 RepID=A0ABR3JE36_9AGAR
MQTPSVLIVGAGPTGLVLGLTLAQNGIAIRIVDKLPEFPPGSRGTGLMPRSLEVHKFLGTYEDIKSAGLSGSNFHARMYPIGSGSENYKVSNLSVPLEPADATPITTYVLIGQDTQTEILRSHLAKYGVNVEFGTELVSFEQEADHVAVRLRKSQDGEERGEDVKFQYIVGADGAHSVVRKGLDMTFLGETRASENMSVGDIYVEDGFLEPNKFHIWGEASTQMLAIRSTEIPKKYNFACSGPQFDHNALSSSREALLKAFAQISGRNDIPWGNISWVSHYRPNIRMVDRFSSGRVFVAGDAAHVHSPAGGQGMNSGCLDAFNLGWKLALAVKGFSKENLLESYDAERLPVIATMLQLTTKIHRTMYTAGTAEEGFNRDGNLNQLGVNYRSSAVVVDERSVKAHLSNPYETEPGSVLSAGDRAPDAGGLKDLTKGGDAVHLFDVYRPTHHTVLVFSQESSEARTFLTAATKAAKGAPLLTALIVPPGASDLADINSDRIFVDQKGSAGKSYVIAEHTTVTAVVVRPDGVIGAIALTVGGLEKYFENILL